MAATRDRSKIIFLKDMGQRKIMIKKSSMVNLRTICAMVTEFQQTKMDMFIVGNSHFSQNLDMDTLSIQTTMNMMANGVMTVEMEKESSRKHRLEELKEGYMNLIKLKKSLK
jgi:hypothetical protein